MHAAHHLVSLIGGDYGKRHSPDQQPPGTRVWPRLTLWWETDPTLLVKSAIVPDELAWTRTCVPTGRH